MSRNLGVPYTDKEPYYFMSYNSEDEKRVAEYAKALTDIGIPLWYDMGIKIGTAWENEIAYRIDCCTAVIMFLSKNIFLKDSSYVHKEFELATEYSEKKVYIIMLDEVKKPEVPIHFRAWWTKVTRLQCLNAYEFSTPMAAMEKFADDIGIENSEIHSESFSDKRQSSIECTDIRVYSGGYNWDETWIPDGYYFKSETKYIWVRLFFDNYGHLPGATMNWEIFREDGTSYSGPRENFVELSSDQHSTSHGWGWNQKGHWDIGKYYIIARLGDSKPMRIDFEIAEGNYSDKKINLNRMKLFAAGDSVDDVGHYEDTRVFYKDVLRRVYFNYKFDALGEDAYVTINYKIYYPSGKTMTNIASPITLKSDWCQCWTGHGWSCPGMWKTGTYKYEVSLGNSKVFCGEFEVR